MKNLNLRALCAPKGIIVPCYVLLRRREVGNDTPGRGALLLASAPHPPRKDGYTPGENSDNRSKLPLWGAWGARFSLFVCFFLCGKRRADAHAPETAVFALDVLGEGQPIPAGVLQQELAELLLCDGRFQIILAPLGVGAIEVCGTLFTVRTEADISLCLHELTQVVAVLHGCFKVPAGAFADGELVIVRQQTLQSFQHPEQDAGEFCGQLLNEVRVIDAGRAAVFLCVSCLNKTFPREFRDVRAISSIIFIISIFSQCPPSPCV